MYTIATALCVLTYDNKIVHSWNKLYVIRLFP